MQNEDTYVYNTKLDLTASEEVINKQKQANLKKQQEVTKYFVKPATDKGFDLENCFSHEEMEKQGMTQETQFEKSDKQEGDYYYDSYSHFNIHEEMLKDETRTNAYRDAIMRNKNLFEGKVVLDVGCGTGILSIFAAQAGAKQVIGVDNASIVRFTRKIIKENKLDHIITVIKGKIEEVELPVKEVDIIISEWMGYYLIYESMLDCVLWARDKYLKKGGLLFPDRAVMFLATVEDDQYFNSKINFWDNVYGVDMSCIKKWAQKEPLVEVIDGRNLNGESAAIMDIDLQTVTQEQLDFASQYKIRIMRDDYIHGFVAWFDCYFSHCHLPVKLSTSPYAIDTHWKQTLFYLTEPLQVFEGDLVTGCIASKKNKDNERNIDVKISWNLKNKIHKDYSNSCYYKIQ